MLIIADYFSNFIEVERIHLVTTSGITKALKPMLPDTDYPVCSCSTLCPSLVRQSLQHLPRVGVFTKSSPRHPQSNGKAENTINMVKRLFEKCQVSGQSEYLTLLDWPNTPTEGIGTSPAQRFLEQHCRTLLPTAGSLLKPQYATEKDTRTL